MGQCLDIAIIGRRCIYRLLYVLKYRVVIKMRLFITISSLIFILLVAALAYFAWDWESKQEASYYNGIYDSCIVIASKLSGGMYTRENAKWCAELTENARRANAFENRVPEPTGGGIDL